MQPCITWFVHLVAKLMFTPFYKALIHKRLGVAEVEMENEM